MAGKELRKEQLIHCFEQTKKNVIWMADAMENIICGGLNFFRLNTSETNK